MAAGDERVRRPHVLLLPYPTQGHVNPLLNLAKRFAFHGARATLAVPRSTLVSARPDTGQVSVAAISDGFDQGGFHEIGDVALYLARFLETGSATLEELLSSESAAGRPVDVVVYDSFIPWAHDTCRKRGVASATFFTQPCAVNLIYGEVWAGRLEMPVDRPVQLPFMPPLEPSDLPSFLPSAGRASYPAYTDMVVQQFKVLDEVDDVLVNSFDELEPQEAKYMAATWRARLVGPTIPSVFLDNRLPDDHFYGFNLVTNPATAVCMSWLESKPPRSVVYTSFGSLSDLEPTQVAEVARGLCGIGMPFLWVVRASEAHKVPADMATELGQKGLIVTWSPQLEVLAHPALGCFFTHCGWNSTLESLCSGVPMVGLPVWTDQPTNAKYIEDVWRVGVRVRLNAEGLASGEEVEKAVREVMEGDKAKVYRENAQKWRLKAKESMREGGSSDRNIVEFLAKHGNPK